MYWDVKRPISDASKVEDWLVHGGTAYDGITYGPPDSAVAWGVTGCPLVPFIYRIRFGQRTAPPLLRSALKAPHLKLADLDSDFLRRVGMFALTPQLREAMRAEFYQLPVLLKEVAIPAGIPVSWLTALPMRGRLRNGLRRFHWPHDWIIEKPFRYSELLAIPAVGKVSLHELLCVLESAELGQSDDRVVSTAQHKQDQDETAHGERQVARKGYPPKRRVLVRGATEHGERQVEHGVSPVKPHKSEDTANPAFQAAVNDAARKALRAGFLHFETHGDFPAVNEGESEIVCSVSALGDLLREFANWALAETVAQTLGEAISQVMLGPRTIEAWNAIAEFSLKQAGYPCSHPYTILESWAYQLPDRERHIFDTRIACLEVVATLQDLGAYFGVTRERVRQLENRVRRKLAIFMKREAAGPVRWRAETIRQSIGVAAPLANVEYLLSTLNGQADYRGIVLGLAGPYDLFNRWLVLKSALSSDPTLKIRDLADEVGFIDPQLAARELKRWGLDMSFHEEWLVQDGKIRKLNGRLVRWDGSIGDKLVIALVDVGRPTTIEALLEYVQEDRAKTSAANALSIDPRVVRVSRTEWALASWGLSEYSGIAMSIRQFLKSQGQPISIEDVVTRLCKDSGMKESSIRAYCQAPMFILEDGAVRPRRNDEPYEYDKVSLHHAKSVFALGPQRVSLRFEVDSELLRGSGRFLTLAAGSILGVALNQLLTFNSRDGVPVTVTFPEASLVGPLIGSVRALAEASRAKLGDQLTLTLDRSDMSVIAVATDLAQHESGWPLVSRLTGINADEGMDGLAAALQCKKGEVRALLSKRGDEVVKDALPKHPVSSELDRALASLEAQLQQVNG